MLNSRLMWYKILANTFTHATSELDSATIASRRVSTWVVPVSLHLQETTTFPPNRVYYVCNRVRLLLCTSYHTVALFAATGSFISNHNRRAINGRKNTTRN
jgi:hypothetical protein